MSLIGNIIWIIFGGLMIAIEYFLAGIALCITIIGIPFGIQSFKMGIFALTPFGSKTRSIEGSSGCISSLFNVIWFFIGGVWIALTHLFWGIILCITIVGIPFGMQHFKLMALALSPFGKEIIEQ